MSHKPADTDTQRRAADLVGSIDVAAPASLHESVRAMAAEAARGAHGSPLGSLRSGAWMRFRPTALLVGAVASAAAFLVVLVLTLNAGGPAAPTVLHASTLGLLPATTSAPEENPRAPGQLAISASGIAYPYWNRRFGWQTAGARSDRLGGRTITTVFYANSSGQRIGYSIVNGQALAFPAESHAAVWHGMRFDVLHPGASTVVTWRRDGHTCILVGSNVNVKTLLTLADWQVT